MPRLVEIKPGIWMSSANRVMRQRLVQDSRGRWMVEQQDSYGVHGWVTLRPATPLEVAALASPDGQAEVGGVRVRAC